jgi:hypothetical protein
MFAQLEDMVVITSRCIKSAVALGDMVVSVLFVATIRDVIKEG